MGLLVPMYPYYSAKGRNAKRNEGDGHYNDSNRAQLKAFFDLLRQPLVKKIGIRCRAFYARNENLDIRRIDWEGPEFYETETMWRPRLEALMDELEERGTIVVPSHEHLTDDGGDAKDLFERLSRGSLAIIAISHPRLQETMQPLVRILQGDRRLFPHDIEARIKGFFHALTSDAVLVRGTVENSRLRKRFN